MPVTCEPASGSTFPVGTTTVTCTAGDGNGNTASASFDITVDLYQASFKAPVDGPSVLNVAKAGRVIPVKVEVFKNSMENSTGPVTIGVAKMLSCTANMTDELETYAAAGFAQAHSWVEQFHRSDRCDLGLFQIGLRAIQYALREGLRVPVSFLLSIDSPGAPQKANGFSVR